jgi:hypothetical protein
VLIKKARAIILKKSYVFGTEYAQEARGIDVFT